MLIGIRISVIINNEPNSSQIYGAFELKEIAKNIADIIIKNKNQFIE